MGSLIDEHVCLIGRGLEAILAMNTWCVPRVGFPVRAHCRVAKPGCRHPLSWKSKAFGANMVKTELRFPILAHRLKC